MKNLVARILRKLSSSDISAEQQKTIIQNEKTRQRTTDEKEVFSQDAAHSTIKDRITTKKGEFRGMFERVIQPEERTLKNYININFWRKKRAEYSIIREKEKQDLNVFSVLKEAALPTIEYYILTILSCIIATIGLLQGSTAVIIGAMIVAPLMTPILAFSLGVIWGDINLIKTSLSSITKGVMLSVFISALISFSIPLPSYTQEILARTKPTLFDIIVALASGIIGAYGNANKKISNTLAGVAIAVALMPPLCTVGIGLGTFNREIAYGAGLLFLINLVSISLAGAIVFWAMKIHPSMEDTGTVARRALSQIAISIIVLIAISIPVGFYMHEGYVIASMQKNARLIIANALPDAEIFKMKASREEGSFNMDISIISAYIADMKKLDTIRNTIKEKHQDIKRLTIRFIQSME